MKKENKQEAKRKKAARARRNSKAKNGLYLLKFWGPIVGTVIVVIFLIWAIATSGVEEAANTNNTENIEKVTQQESETSEVTEDYNREKGIVVKNKDTINVDYVGYIDGEEFVGGSTQGAGRKLVLGAGETIEGFDQGIIGHKVGEIFDVKTTFPEDYWSKDKAGKDVVFTVTINGIYQ